MAEGFRTRLKNAWDVFSSKKVADDSVNAGWVMGDALKPDRTRLRPGNERSILNSVITRIAVDVSQISIQHVRLDEQGRYKETIDDSLNRCLTRSANVDQTGKALIQDMIMTLCDEGVIAVVPTVTSEDPNKVNSFSIEEMRVGKITEWYPTKVRVSLYNDLTGKRQELVLDKKYVSIIENPLYAIMNEPNSTFRRLIRKLNILDAIDEQSGAGKLDIIVQLPYTVKSDLRKKQAEERRKDIEMQLAGSKYGIAYIDGTEHVTQLNRPAENNLMAQITYLTNEFFNQLGMSEAVFDGTANEAAMLNYQNKTIKPLVSALVDEFDRKWITQTARTQGQAIRYFSDPFSLVPVSQLAEIADKFTRNEILSSNEFRAIIGYKPVDDPRADELRNSNLNRGNEEQFPSTKEEPEDE